MKYRIKCDYCLEENEFGAPDRRPQSCANCHSPLGHLAVQVLSDEGQPMHPDGLVLEYQKTGQHIRLEHGEIVVLGRQNSGREVLGAVPQISREHCKIEYVNGSYAVTDLNSLNGTWYGKQRRNCRKHQQVPLADGEILRLGREEFRISLRYKPGESISEKNGQDGDLPAGNVVFKCRACGKIHSMNLIICDECGTYGQLEPVHQHTGQPSKS